MKGAKRARNGSALLVTLLTVSLLLVLVLALVVTVRMELRKVTEHQNLLEAQANARLGANLALAELQRMMGPDTRVSARAEILTTANPDGHGGGIPSFNAHESTRFWTGVWDSEQEWLGAGLPENAGPRDPKPYRPYKGNRGNRFRSWLVSLPQEDLDNILIVRDPVSGSDALTVGLARVRAEPLSGGAAVLTEVRAPLIPMGSTAATAWWVSDEGVKANVTLTDPYRGQSVAGIDDISRRLFPHRENFAATEWFEDTDFDDPDMVERLQKLGAGTNAPGLAFRDADLSQGAVTALAGPTGTSRGDSLFSDYTLLSKGVLSNNKKGGLRKDLSLAFWRDPDEIQNPTGGISNEAFNTDFSNRVNLHGRIFNVEDFPTTTVRERTDRAFFGPQWDTLRDFHNSHQKFLNDPASAEPVAFLDQRRLLPGSDSNALGLLGGPMVRTRDSLRWSGQITGKGDILVEEGDAGRVRTHGIFNSALSPVILGTQYNFAFNVVSVGDNEYQPELRVSTVITLWNPYNVSISPTRNFGPNVNQWLIDFYISDTRFFIEKNGEHVTSATWRNIIQSQQTSGGANIGGQIGTTTEGRSQLRLSPHGGPSDRYGENMEFEPGEIRQYRLVSIADSAILEGGGSERPNFISARWSEESIKFRVPSNTTWSAADELSVRMEFKQQRVGQGGGAFDGVRLELYDQRAISGGISAPYPQPIQEIHFDYFTQDDDDLENLQNVGQLFGGDDLFVGAVEVALKSVDGEGTDVAGIFANFNPRALFPGGALVSNYDGNQGPNYIARIVSTPTDINTNDSDPDRMRGFWGISRDSVGESFIPLFDVPRRPPESLGQYQHANLSLFGSQPAYAFGNSMAHPHVNRAYAHSTPLPFAVTQIDLSWFLNDAIWDDYFLSTIDLDRDPSIPQRERFLPIDPSLSYSVHNADDYKEVAANLLLRGAFNVNSTSVEAWTAFLSALGGTTPSGNLDFPYHRFSHTTESPNTPWTGAPRDLSAGQIRTLAERMVEEVRRRGPFLSLSDFVNRRLATGETGAMGAVQAAIEAAGINTILPGTTGTLSEAPYSGNFPDRVAALAPGDVSQADVLTTIGPKMSVRSDTFIIRSYGRTENSETEAWSEMLVQRMPEQMDPADPTNPFGRRFRILHFRYLNQDEI